MLQMAAETMRELAYYVTENTSRTGRETAPRGARPGRPTRRRIRHYGRSGLQRPNLAGLRRPRRGPGGPQPARARRGPAGGEPPPCRQNRRARPGADSRTAPWRARVPGRVVAALERTRREVVLDDGGGRGRGDGDGTVGQPDGPAAPPPPPSFPPGPCSRRRRGRCGSAAPRCVGYRRRRRRGGVGPRRSAGAPRTPRRPRPARTRRRAASRPTPGSPPRRRRSKASTPRVPVRSAGSVGLGHPLRCIADSGVDSWAPAGSPGRRTRGRGRR